MDALRRTAMDGLHGKKAISEKPFDHHRLLETAHRTWQDRVLSAKPVRDEERSEQGSPVPISYGK